MITAFQRRRVRRGGDDRPPEHVRERALRSDLRAVHDEALAAAGEGVRADGRFVDGSADDVLRGESAELDLLVVGSRGYGPVGAVLIGSATTALARGAACPILVTPRGSRFDLLD